MKIGILTYHKTTNYGALFQAYALQKYLNSCDVECEIIDYNNKTIKSRYNNNIFQSKSLKTFLKKSINYRTNKKLQKSFTDFSENHINKSINEYNEINIKETEKFYDKFIVGSDQIWNLKLSGYDKNYFLDFIKESKKKNSYAASFGITNFSDEEKKTIKNSLKTFSNISVRENQGISLIREIGVTQDVSQCIDPVFLLSSSSWNKFIGSPIEKQKYILVYEITYTENLKKFATYLAKKKKCNLIFISGSNKRMGGAKVVNTATPEEFLNYLKYADYVVTSSFHGTSLSIIFHKNFYYDLPSIHGSTGSRLESLATLAKLESRRIQSNFDKNDFKNIDYVETDKALSKEIKKSKNYIKNILEG